MANTTLTATESPNLLYSGTIDPPLQFQSGDLLGMYIPPFFNAQLRVRFSRQAESTFKFTTTDEPLSSITLTGQGTGIGRPLLALEISECPLSAAVLC